MTSSVFFDKSLIAPCGMNCGTCMAYQRERNKCCGCWPDNTSKPASCKRCIVRNCELLSETDSKFCYECEKFPCLRIKQLDKRYRTKYHVSFIQNLLTIKEIGIKNYLVEEGKRWTCPQCGGPVSVHRNNCLKCNNVIKFADLK
jgi:hypothetical protein